jgi:hypothetical protein
MSGYGDGEALILTLAAAVSGFTNTSATARGSWLGLNSGKSDRYAIIHTTPAERLFETPTTVLETWETVVEVWRKYTRDGTSYTNLTADVTAILAKIDKYPHLNDQAGYVESSTAYISSGPQEMWTRGGGPQWIRQDITVRWTGRQAITYTAGG